MKTYNYVGPKRITERVRSEPAGAPIGSPGDVRRWVHDSSQEDVAGCVTATFVIDESGKLLIADRHSEHVVCAGGKPVRSAGEITFFFSEGIEVVAVSNQSLGYCPEPESWPAVVEALTAAGLDPPDEWTLACVFRRCTRCAEVALVKDEVFECAECGGVLPHAYNVQG